ncbi:MAG: ribosome small subunit-dependent GTPase A [Rikenellaceae bacterium]
MKIVTKSTGSWYELLDQQTLEFSKARLRGALRLRGSRSTNPVVVGDFVTTEGQGEDMVIAQIEPRRNYIIRRSSNLSKESHILAANIDRVYIVSTVSFPMTSPEFIDRILVTAELYSIPSTIIINKCDVEGLEDYLSEIYQMAGYPVIRLSALTGEGVDQLRAEIAGRTVLFTGNSGVGKSTLINAIDPSIKARTGNISAAHLKGKHTTTFSEIFRFGEGFLIDTPGVKGFGLVELKPDELYRSFPDLMHFASGCQFHNCSHTHEPRCAVVDALERGLIHPSRYESYLKMMEDDKVKYR